MSRQAFWLPAMLLAALAFFAFHKSLSTPFIFDDRLSTTSNPHIGVFWPLSVAMDRPPRADVVARPVVTLSLSLNYKLGGFDPFGFHIFNTAIHALSALLLYALLFEIFRRGEIPDSEARSQQTAAWLVAAVWAFHPLQTQAVIYTIQRGELLAGLFHLAVLYALLRSDTSAYPQGWWFAGTLAGLLGMASKPVMVVVPLIAVVFDRLLLAESWAKLWSLRRFFYAGLFLSWLVLWALVAAAPSTGRSSAGFDVAGLNWWEYARTQPQVILHYLRLVFWPHPLCFDYDWPIAQRLIRQTLLPAASLLLLGWMLRRFSGKKRIMGLMIAWFLLSLSPTSFLVPINDIAVEHRMYVALTAVIAAIAIVLTEGWLRMRLAFSARPLVVASAGLLLAGLISATWQRSAVYASESEVWRDVLQTHPGNMRALENLGASLTLEGQVLRALPYVEKALALDPDNPKLYDQLACLRMQQGRWQEAEELFATALAKGPALTDTYAYLAVLLVKQRRLDEALWLLSRAMALEPRNPFTHYNFANGLIAFGDRKTAKQILRRALLIDPQFIPAWRAIQKLEREDKNLQPRP